MVDMGFELLIRYSFIHANHANKDWVYVGMGHLGIGVTVFSKHYGITTVTGADR